MFEKFQMIHKTFMDNGVENPLVETLQLYDILLKHAISKADANILDEIGIDLERLSKERKEGIPTEYIIGKAPFMGNLFFCSPDALIPREETELLTKIAINILSSQIDEQKELTVIDMGTGSGNIAVSIAMNVQGVRVLASDLSDGHVSIAQKNAAHFNVLDRITFFCGDLFAPIESKGYDNGLDMIICNPPYIPTASLKKLNPVIKNNEPETAFNGGAFGIDIFRRLINDGQKYLKKNGILIFEIGVGQEKLVTRLFDKNNNYNNIEYFDDGEHVRVIKLVYQGV